MSACRDGSFDVFRDDCQMPEAETPTLDSFFPQAKVVARRIAWIEADVDDLVQEGMIELWTALKAPSEPIKSYPAFASRIFTRRMQRFYSKGLRNQSPHLELREEVLPTPETREDRLLSRIELENFFDAIEIYQGKTERWIAESLLSLHGDIASSPKALARSCVLAGLKTREIIKLLSFNFPSYKSGYTLLWQVRKKLREEGLLEGTTLTREVGCETLRINHRQLRESLSLSVPAWFAILARVREFSLAYFA